LFACIQVGGRLAPPGEFPGVDLALARKVLVRVRSLSGQIKVAKKGRAAVEILSEGAQAGAVLVDLTDGARSVDVFHQFFGDLLRSVREERSLSLEEAGRRAGITASQWEAIEAGRVPTTLDQLQALAAGLDIEWSAMAGLAVLCRQAWRN
jgi:hypothetical protein